MLKVTTFKKQINLIRVNLRVESADVGFIMSSRSHYTPSRAILCKSYVPRIVLLSLKIIMYAHIFKDMHIKSILQRKLF